MGRLQKLPENCKKTARKIMSMNTDLFDDSSKNAVKFARKEVADTIVIETGTRVTKTG